MSNMAAPVIVSIVVVVGIAVGWSIRRFCTPLPKQKPPKSKRTTESQTQGAFQEEQVYHKPSHNEGLYQRPPKVRTVEEIKAQYGRSSNKTDQFKDNSAAEAKRKLMERGQKLGEINEKTEELQADAETFSSLAEELAKKMENRKWWQF